MQSQIAPALPSVPAPPAVGSPTAVWRAFQAQRDELSNQLENATSARQSLSEQLSDPQVSGPNKAGIELRIATLDKQIQSLDQQLADANQSVARAAATPGAVQPRPREVDQGPPDGAFIVGGLFILVVFLPLSIAMARRIWKRSSAAVAQLPSEIMERLARLDQAVDSIAVEVERIGEGQRFVTRVMTERGHVLGAGPAQPIDVPAKGERIPVGERRT